MAERVAAECEASSKSGFTLGSRGRSAPPIDGLTRLRSTLDASDAPGRKVAERVAAECEASSRSGLTLGSKGRSAPLIDASSISNAPAWALATRTG